MSLSPCQWPTLQYSLFSVEHYIQLRAQSNFLNRDELDLTVIGAIMPLCPLSCMMTMSETAAIKILKGESKQEHCICITVMRYAKKQLPFCMALVKID